MGAYLSEPMTNKESEEGEGNKLKFGASSMQGWRVSQEDAHNCVASFDENSSLFAVYDGHGGAEVAIYLSRHLPEFLKNCESYKNGEFMKALEECYLKIDESIKTPEVLKEIQQIAKRTTGTDEAQVDYEEENVGALYEEATMPLDRLMAKYQSGSNEDNKEDAETDAECKPGSSKSMSTAGPSSSSSSPSGSKAGSSKSVSNETVAAVASSAGSSTASSSSSCVSSSESKNKVNGESKESIAEGPADSSSSSADPKPTKTEAEEKEAKVDSSCDLIVQGTKLELKNEKKESSESNNVAEIDSSSASSIKTSNGHPISNGTITENGEKQNKDDSSKENVRDAEPSESKPAVMNGSTGGGVSSTQQESEAVSTNTNETKEEGSATPDTPRRKKVHPTPIPIEDSKPERRSPRKNQRAPDFELLDSEDSDDEEDEDAGYNVGDGESDSDEEGEEEESSEEEGDDDDDEEYEDEEEEEDEQFLSDMQEPGYDSGCTAVVCYMKWEGDGLSLWVANAGDSRCVVCREGKAIDMSHDHKPELDVEAQRIVKAGGKVTEDGRVNGGLNLSRAIGDHSYKQNVSLPPQEQMISPLPSIEHIVLNPNKDKFVVLACDGIWNSMSSQEVVDFVDKRIEDNKPLAKICEELFDSCLAQDTCGDGTGCDNMTAIIIQLSDSPQVFSGSKRKLSAGAEGNDGESKKTRIELEQEQA